MAMPGRVKAGDKSWGTKASLDRVKFYFINF